MFYLFLERIKKNNLYINEIKSTSILLDIYYLDIFIFFVKKSNYITLNIGNTFETIDPRNEEVIARISEGDKEDIDLAVKAAREAFDNGPWPRLSAAVYSVLFVSIYII